MSSLKPLSFFLLPEGQRVLYPSQENPGFALFVRAIVSVEKEKESRRRQTLFDFKKPGWQVLRPSALLHIGFDNTGIYYRLEKGKSLLVGLGVTVEVPDDCVGYIKPVFGNVQKSNGQCRLEIANSDVPICPKDRSELCAEIVNHGPEEFWLRKGQCLCQLILAPVVRVPEITIVDFPEQLPQSMLKSHVGAANGTAIPSHG